MATRYCDCDLGTGDNDGTSWANAWRTFQQALDATLAGEICYCKGTDTLGATLDVDTQSGTNAAGYIRFIGCNSSGNVDGTRFVINGNGGAYHGLTMGATAILLWFENVEITNCGNSTILHGVMFNTSGASSCVFINSTFHNCGGYGIYAYRNTNALYWRCSFYLNGSDGNNYISSSQVLFCRSYDNTGSGFGFSSASTIIGSLSYDNGDDGVEDLTSGTMLFNCAIDANADDGVMARATTTAVLMGALVGTRITNHSGAGDIGLNANSENVITAYCYFEDNDGDNIQNTTLHYNIPIENTASTTSNIEDQSNTTEGYTDRTDDAEDYNLNATASLRRTAITIPRT